MILVTGAAGKTGRAVLRAFSQKGVLIRALVRHSEQMGTVSSIGAQESLAGDMKSPATVGRAVQGVQVIYHICPNVSPDEIPIAEILIKSAQDAGVGLIVYHSVLKPQIEAMPHHWNKLRVEEMLIESGIPYTILQPAAYMQNILAHWESIHDQGIFPVPYPAETRLSLVDLVDVAQAAAIVLAEPGHENATYELVGTNGLSQHEIAAVLSDKIGHPVRADVMDLNTWERQSRESGLGDYQINALVKMFRYYQRFDFLGNPQILTWLLGHSPTTFEAFVDQSILRQSLATEELHGNNR
jgi:uncharacterized protein YbjT (DUF2867 family)